MSSSNEQRAIDIEARIIAAQTTFRDQLAAFIAANASDASLDEKRSRFLDLVGHATSFANICEQSVGDTNLLGATRNEAWARNKAETSLNALDTILQSQQTLATVAENLQLPAETVRPSPTAFASLQRQVALFFPERVEALRRAFEDAGLPVVGFDDIAPLSTPRLHLRELRQGLRSLHSDVTQLATKHPDAFVPVDALRAQLLKYEAEGARLTATHAPWLTDRWTACGHHRQARPSAYHRVSVLTDQVPLRALANELGERLELLSLVETEIIRIDERAHSASAHYFHVLAQNQDGTRAIANDLTRERLLSEIVEPLRAGNLVRVDGHAVSKNAPVLKIARTDRDTAALTREHDLRAKRSGIWDLSVNRRQLPIDHGEDVTALFLGPHVQMSKPPPGEGEHVARIQHTIAWFGFILSLAAIAAGVVALILNSAGTSKLDFKFATIDTSSTGVACIGIGILGGILSLRSVLRNVKEMEQLRLEVAKAKKATRTPRKKPNPPPAV